MGRSKNACLSILTCAGAGGGGGDVAADPANTTAGADECHSEESKILSDKSRWSFRRRSTRHRVLRNNESTEMEPVTNNKEYPNSDPINDNSNNNVYSPKYSSATTEKTVEQEKPPKENNIVVREIEEKSKENDIVIKDGVKETDDELKENLVVEERKEKPKEDDDVAVVKDLEVDLEQVNLPASEDASKIHEQNENLEPSAVIIQSGFRGYMARKEMVKVKKVVKIQAVARGYLVRSHAVGTLRCLLAIIKMQAVVRSHQTPKKADIIGATQGNGGGFIQGNRTCASNDNLLLNGFACKIMDTMPKTKAIHIKCDPYKPDSTWQWLERWTYTINPSNGSTLPDQKEIIESEVAINIIESNADDLHADLPPDTPNSNSDFKFRSPIETPEDGFCTNAIIPKEEPEVKLTENGAHSHEIKEEMSNLLPELEIKHENDLPCEEKPELADLTETNLEENEVEKTGNRKLINPNFVAAQMKFEVLSSNSNSNPSVGRSVSSNLKFFDDASSKNNNNIRNRENNNSNIAGGGALIKAASECGTEISISSTLDSPDRSETEGGEIVLELGTLENKNYRNHTDSTTTETKVETGTKNPDLEFQPEPTVKESNKTITDSNNPGTTESVEIEKLLRSPEGTPISRTTTTVTDAHGTPSSQSSVNNNTKRTKRGERKKKPINISTKRSLNSPISDSNGVIKRHGSSVGHTGDAEPRISNSSLPSYMQATESARAKLHASVSPKLSPDVNETNNGSGKKRHSLPIGGTDSSPRMQRSQSHQAQVNAKGTGTHSHGSSDKR